MYSGVPTAIFVAVSVCSFTSPPDSSTTFAIPKSPRYGFRNPSRKMLPGFTSRWSMPLA